MVTSAYTFPTIYQGCVGLVAGGNKIGYTGNHNLASSALLGNATGGMDVDSSGNVYIADGGNNAIRKNHHFCGRYRVQWL